MPKHYKDIMKGGPFSGFDGYQWKNNHSENIIARISPGLDLIIGQHLQTREDPTYLYGKAEASWTKMVGIAVKYAALFNRMAIQKVLEDKNFHNYKVSKETKSAIDTFLKTHNFVYWDTRCEMNDILSSPLDKVSVIIKRENNIHYLSFVDIKPKANWADIAENPSLRDDALIEKIRFEPVDSEHLLRGLMKYDPMGHELEYAVSAVNARNSHNHYQK